MSYAMERLEEVKGELGIARAEIWRLTEQLHYANGTCDLAMEHRDAAEAEVKRLTAALEHVIGACQDCEPKLAVEASLAIASGVLERKLP